jgi:hypothetical protein
MNNIETLAMNKAVTKKVVDASRKNVTAGKYHVDMTVRVRGDLSVGEDTETTPTASLLSVDFLLLAFHAAGITRKAAMKAIGNVADGYLVNWTGSKEDKEKAKEARQEALDAYDPDGKMKELFSSFKDDLPKVPKKGSVKFKGEVEEIFAEKALIKAVG